MDGIGGVEKRLGQLADMAGMLGKAAVLPTVQDLLREQLVSILQENDPEVLRNYIYVDYPLVREELPEKYQEVLSDLGPKFEDEIKAMVHPDNILSWLESPEAWMDVEENPELAEQVRECHRIIEETEGGREWLSMQTYHLYLIAGIADSAS
jgi:hypothetical protein